MAEKSTIARPYAKALFELALEQTKLDTWSEALALAAAVVADERVKKLLTSPRVTIEQLADLVIGIVGKKLDDEGHNFIRVLAANRRLGFLPEIAAIYEKLKAAEENTVEVTVTSAVPLDKEQQRKFSQAMSARLKRDVRLHCEVDATLLGGAVLRADDLVIDGSLRGQLERLNAELTG
ncbi:MAG TPA: F0F1 ATP synthase subunit delta [Steroidobacteraceae bacterium]